MLARVLLVTSLASLASAQVTAPFSAVHKIETIALESDVLPVTGDTDTDPSCLAVLPDGDLVYVDTDPGTDLVLHWERDTQTFTVITDEPTLGALSPAGATSVVAFESVQVDADRNVYLLIGDASGIVVPFPFYVEKIPWTGVGNGYGGSTPALAGPFFDSPNFVQQMLIDRPGNRLLFLRDTGLTADDANTGVGANGVYSLSLLAPQPLPGPQWYLQHAAFPAIAAGLSPGFAAGSEPLGSESIAYGHNRVYFANTASIGKSTDGAIVRVDLLSGAVTPFLDRATYLADTNKALGLSRGGRDDVHPMNLLLDEERQVLYVLEDAPHSIVNGTNPVGTDAAIESLVAYDSVTGAFLGVVASNDTLRQHYAQFGVGAWPSIPEGNTTFTFANHPLALGPDGAIYVFFVNVGEMLIRIEPDFGLLRARPTENPPASGELSTSA